MAENSNLLFIHEHQVSIATAKRISNTCFSIDGYLEAKKNDNLTLPIFNIYISFYCQTCGKIIMKSKIGQELFVFSSKKMKGLKNTFNEKKKLESICLEDNPNINLINNPELITRPFYLFNELPLYDNDTIYVGTDEEKIKFFHKKYKDFEHYFNEVTNKGLIF